MKQRTYLSASLVFFGLLGSPLCLSTPSETDTASESDPAEIAIGERLFLETRFAQAYYANPDKADPSLKYTVTMDQPLRGPFAGKTMNCRACHLVDEHLSEPSAGMRTYADFSHTSPIPARNDGKHTTDRNAMSLVNISVATQHGNLFHFDGQFNSMQDLVRATLTGRNYGWLASESDQAIKHIANVIRTDDGKDELAREFGGNYRTVLASQDKDIPAEFRLPSEFRIDVDNASDEQIVGAVAKLISAYVNDLNFARDEQGNYTGSPYDQFLKLNNLPRQPKRGESPQAYANRLLTAVSELNSPKFISGKQQSFQYHKQSFAFTADELKGMKLFFTRSDNKTRGGNCVSCHTPPHFSDFGFHNTGLSQTSYDEIHGAGSFAKLVIPELRTRNKNYDQYLPATAQHPAASERFRTYVNFDKPGYTDLGLWNVFANPDMPVPQEKLTKILCQQHRVNNCTAKRLLPLTIAAFKTPVLRDLGHSNPYFHNGQFNTLEEAVNFYITSSALAKSGQLRNADRELSAINISTRDIAPLVAFLKALNEDYD
jgi:cytochrome c peroxidase